jgi:putative ABC transport system substrate-binding protein
MRRRIQPLNFVQAMAGFGGGSVAARGARAAVQAPGVGFLASASEARYTETAAAVRRGLNEAGYVEKQNLLIDYRWADFQYERLPALAAELVLMRRSSGR